VSAADPLYFGREQTQVKHEVLRRYLNRFAHIIGSWAKSITYIDGFAGPWNVVSDDWKDSSFSIAVSQLNHARKSHQAHGKDFRVRCYFVEARPESYEALSRFRKAQTDIEIETANAELEDVVGDCVKFVKRDRSTFAFSFIDPTGWKGISLDTIRPLLLLQPGEVLVNFMTSFITRHISTPSVKAQIAAVFGSAAPLERVAKLRGMDRVDACVDEYCSVLKSVGGFEHVSPAVILQPTKDRPHFHLIYATRKDLGLEVFKDVERNAMETMEKARAGADQRKQATSGQRSFLDADDMPESQYYIQLRERYTSGSRRDVRDLIQSRGRVPYDAIWAEALRKPLVWESDLKQWLALWRQNGAISLEGLKNERVPKRGRGHMIVCQDKW
jgi:three-Cys-motif partner protein